MPMIVVRPLDQPHQSTPPRSWNKPSQDSTKTLTAFAFSLFPHLPRYPPPVWLQARIESSDEDSIETLTLSLILALGRAAQLTTYLLFEPISV